MRYVLVVLGVLGSLVLAPQNVDRYLCAIPGAILLAAGLATCDIVKAIERSKPPRDKEE